MDYIFHSIRWLSRLNYGIHTIFYLLQQAHLYTKQGVFMILWQNSHSRWCCMCVSWPLLYLLFLSWTTSRWYLAPTPTSEDTFEIPLKKRWLFLFVKDVAIIIRNWTLWSHIITANCRSASLYRTQGAWYVLLFGRSIFALFSYRLICNNERTSWMIELV